MKSHSVVFIAFEERDNLGIGYLSAVLSQAGYHSQVIDYREDWDHILDELIQSSPLLLGFSIIFEEHLYGFSDLVEHLRNRGVKCHFTAGGHFASLRPAELFDIIPSLDSIVRFEGEHTILDLTNYLQQGTNWRSLMGISHRSNGTVINNPLRPMEKDLDNFPFPLRTGIRDFVLGKKYTTLISGRGCTYNCRFCDIREFYGQAPGPVKRIRNPAKVVEEMDYHYKQNNCTVFLFQDDDFPVKPRDNQDWVVTFCQELLDKNLSGKIMWKINCRPDEVEYDSFQRMKRHGLFRVFLGIEDGTDQGLTWMNKHLRATDNRKSVDILKNLGISIDYGFMLFHPETSYLTFRENLTFLDQVCRDGYMPLYFLKMMPYLATRIEKDLREAGRLKGKPGFLDYDFRDESMNDFHAFISESLSTWLYDPEGLVNIAKWADICLSLFSIYQGNTTRTKRLKQELKEYISEANSFISDLLLELSLIFESGESLSFQRTKKGDYKDAIDLKHNTLIEKIAGIIRQAELFSLTGAHF